jgi:hypothetical protein
VGEEGDSQSGFLACFSLVQPNSYILDHTPVPTPLASVDMDINMTASDQGMSNLMLHFQGDPMNLEYIGKLEPT